MLISEKIATNDYYLEYIEYVRGCEWLFDYLNTYNITKKATFKEINFYQKNQVLFTIKLGNFLFINKNLISLFKSNFNGSEINFKMVFKDVIMIKFDIECIYYVHEL